MTLFQLHEGIHPSRPIKALRALVNIHRTVAELSWVGSVKPRPSMTRASSTNRQAPITGPSSGTNPVLRGYEPRGLPVALPAESGNSTARLRANADGTAREHVQYGCRFGNKGPKNCAAGTTAANSTPRKRKAVPRGSSTRHGRTWSGADICSRSTI